MYQLIAVTGNIYLNDIIERSCSVLVFYDLKHGYIQVDQQRSTYNKH